MAQVQTGLQSQVQFSQSQELFDETVDLIGLVFIFEWIHLCRRSRFLNLTEGSTLPRVGRARPCGPAQMLASEEGRALFSFCSNDAERRGWISTTAKGPKSNEPSVVYPK